MNNQDDFPYLPEKIAGMVAEHISQCKNLSLILDKYIPRKVIDNTVYKGPWLREKTQRPIDTALAQAVYDRRLLMLKALNVKPFCVPLDWRMIVGLGGETVLETDITLHHLYGLPFIPGSALKGLTRAYVAAEHREFFVPSDKPEDQRKPSLKDETDHSTIQRIFGTQKETGTVLFFDAIPQNSNCTFVVDIMNPHYSDYYKKSNTAKVSQSAQANTEGAEPPNLNKDMGKGIIPPANDQKPKLVTFLAVTNTIFAFALAPRDANNPEHQTHVEQVKTWLREALHHYGIGAKTSSGYGRMELEPPPIDLDLKKAEGYKREIDALKDVAGQIQGFYQKWQKLESEKGRTLLAQAIVEKVRQARREEKTAGKAWYKELQVFLDASQS